jgi:hypothetical protein
MERYGNRSGNSGVIAYELWRNHIDVQFVDGFVYRYAIPSIRPSEFEEMKRCATVGSGLSSYISRRVKDRYTDKSWHPPFGSAPPQSPSSRSGRGVRN